MPSVISKCCPHPPSPSTHPPAEILQALASKILAPARASKIKANWFRGERVWERENGVALDMHLAHHMPGTSPRKLRQRGLVRLRTRQRPCPGAPGNFGQTPRANSSAFLPPTQTPLGYMVVWISLGFRPGVEEGLEEGRLALPPTPYSLLPTPYPAPPTPYSLPPYPVSP